MLAAFCHLTETVCNPSPPVIPRKNTGFPRDGTGILAWLRLKKCAPPRNPRRHFALLMPPSFRFTASLFAFIVLFAVALVAPALAQLNSQEQQIATFLANDPAQGRSSVAVDPILSSVARARARDLAVRDYFSHTDPDGHGANYLVRQAGYPLPSHYNSSPSGNSR